MVENVPFCVDRTPYCVWDEDLSEKNKQFIRSLAADQFSYLAETYADHLTMEAKANQAATALRFTYLHALETIFAVTFAMLQAPLCMFGWLGKYRIEQLHALVRKAGADGEGIANRHFLSACTWPVIAELVLRRVPEEVSLESGNTIERAVIQSGFANALQNMAGDFQSEDAHDEFNSVKHGFRIGRGGFALGFRRETEPGVEDLSQPLTMLVNSKHGSRSFGLEPIHGSKLHFGVGMTARNWDAESQVQRLQVAAAWLGNVKAALQYLLGDDDPKPKFEFLTSKEAFAEPWRTRLAVPSMTMHGMSFKRVPSGSAKDVLDTYGLRRPA